MDEATLKFAKHVALKLNSDPEVEGEAYLAAIHAERTFNPAKGVKYTSWVAFLVTQAVRGWHRELEELDTNVEWNEVRVEAPTDTGDRLGLDALSWRALVEFYLEGAAPDEDRVAAALAYLCDQRDCEAWRLHLERTVFRIPLDIIGRRRGVSRGIARRMVKWAQKRLGF